MSWLAGAYGTAPLPPGCHIVKQYVPAAVCETAMTFRRGTQIDASRSSMKMVYFNTNSTSASTVVTWYFCRGSLRRSENGALGAKGQIRNGFHRLHARHSNVGSRTGAAGICLRWVRARRFFAM
jgi:hypothetical protein